MKFRQKNKTKSPQTSINSASFAVQSVSRHAKSGIVAEAAPSAEPPPEPPPAPENPPPEEIRQSIITAIASEVSQDPTDAGSVRLEEPKKRESERPSRASTVYSVISELKNKSTIGTTTLDMVDGDEMSMFSYAPPRFSTATTETVSTLEGESQQVNQMGKKLSVIPEEDSDQFVVMEHSRTTQADEGSIYNLIEGRQTIDTINTINTDIDIFKKVISTQTTCKCRTCHSNESQHTTFTSASSNKRSSLWNYDSDDDIDNSFMQSSSQISVNDGPEYFLLVIAKVIPTKKIHDMLTATGGERPVEEFALRWNFLRYPDKVYFTDMEGGDFVLEYNRMYSFKLSEDVYMYLKKCVLPVELYVKYAGEKFKMIGRAEIQLGNALRNPNKTFSTVVEINNKLLRMCGLTSPNFVYGDIVCSYGFGGDPSRYEAAKHVQPALPKIPPKGDGTYMNLLKRNTISNIKYSHSDLDQLELKAFQTGLNLTLIRNSALKVTPEDISKELKERVDWMHDELLWKLTLQENAILAGIDPATVRWRQWKDEYISHVKFRPTGNEQFKQTLKADFSITIVELQINPQSRIVLDDSIMQLYVEYSFLHYSGAFLETPCHMKPESDFVINYNFKKTFLLDKKDKAARILAEMVKNNESIVFTVVSEPFPNEQQCQTCVDLGSCQLNMFDLVQNDSDVLSRYFTIIDHWDDAEIGKLKIDVSGIFSMRAMALRILTPESFNIFR